MLKQLYRFFSPKHQNIFLEYRVDPRPRFGHGLPTHAGLEKIISARTPQYHEIVKRILALKDALQQSGMLLPRLQPAILIGTTAFFRDSTLRAFTPC